MKLIFVTSSPRRIEFLRKFNLKFNIIMPKSEPKVSFRDPCKTAIMRAKGKVESVLPRIPQDSIVMAADTIVYVEGKVLGKPRSKEEAIEIPVSYTHLTLPTKA